jgi:2-polyprenyl-3-methyl-5-hydroxy-6-metoxy-1,4-benzoquinol methylase
MPPSPEAVRPLSVRIARRIPYVRWAARRLGSLWESWHRDHERSVRNLTRKNTLRGYNRVYRSDSLLAEYLSPERRRFYEEVAQRCTPYIPRRIVDVGCGTGELLRLLVDRLSAEPELVVGVDASRGGIRRARGTLAKARWVVGDLYRLPADLAQFDLVLCTEVLEHVREPRRAIDVLRRLCASDGRVAVTVPDGAQDSWEGHVNFWTETELRRFLEPEGLLELERIEDGRAFLAWLAPKS